MGKKAPPSRPALKRVLSLELRGKGILLRPPRLTDADRLYRYIKDKEIARYTLLPQPYHRADMVKWLKQAIKAMKAGTQFVFVIRRHDSPEPIGTVALSNYRPKSRNAEIGYWLARKFWNQGIATQAVRLVLQFAFDRLKLHRVGVSHIEPNDASRRVIEKCWFRREGLSREAVSRNRRWYDLVCYGLLEQEYRQATRGGRS